jgi:hypothetical protein
MPMFEGKAGTPLEIETESHLLSCRWSLSQACAGGVATLLVLTDYVGRDCPMSFSVFDEDGKRIDELRGKVVNNICAMDWIVPKTAKGRLFFLAESKAVGISGRSDLLQVLEHARFGPVEAQDQGGNAITQVNVGEPIRWMAKMPGIPDGTNFRWTILCHQDPAHVHVAAKGAGQVSKGCGAVDWQSALSFAQGDKKSQADLDPTSETYQDATFQAIFEGLGVLSRSEQVAARTWVLIHMEGTRRRHSVTSPDGTKKTFDASRNPDLRMESLGVGSGWIAPSDQAD